MILRRLGIRSFHTRPRLLNSSNNNNQNLSTHNDIPSFLAYARNVSLRSNRTTFQGTLYEYTVQKALADLSPSFALSRVGGRGDLGIDLFGQWFLPQPPITVAVQCKFHKTEGPSAVRDLIGAITSSAKRQHNQRILGILACRSKFTAGIRNALMTSQVPLAFIKVSPPKLNTAMDAQVGGGELQQFVWNRAAADYLLSGLGVTAVYGTRTVEAANIGLEPKEVEEGGESKKDDEQKQEQEQEQEDATPEAPSALILTFNGRPLPRWEHPLPSEALENLI